ncbi:MAG TPA: hypothetical protein VMV10_00150 [Pirellulales bacterium]|nr:hypothetical protein [Pirellulales bacterium]
MMRSILLLAAVLPICWGVVGCHACQGTYDYCGPLPDEPCDFFYRRNSILGGDSNVSSAETEEAPAAKEEENVPTPAPEQPDGGLQYMPSPTPMPPEADMPSESEPPPDSDSAPETAPRPGAKLRPQADPYAFRPQRSRGLLGSLFHLR